MLWVCEGLKKILFKNKKKTVIFAVMVLILLGLIVKQSIEELTINKFGHFVEGPRFNDKKGIFNSYMTNTALLSNGKVVVFGSYSDGTKSIRYKSEIYDPETNTLKVIDILPDKDWQYTGVTLGNQVLLSVGSKKSNPDVLYDIEKNKITKDFRAVIGTPFAVINNRFIINYYTKYCTKNYNCTYQISKFDIITEKSEDIIKIQGSFLPQDPAAYAVLDKDRIFFYSGYPYILNIKNKTLEQLKTGIKRRDPVLVKLNNSDILILGGRNKSSSDFHLNCDITAEIFNSKTLKFRPVGQMTMPRCSLFSSGFSATLMNDGRVLIAGGQCYRDNYIFSFSGPKILKSTEIYDPTTNTFTKSANLKRARTKPHMILLKNGDIFVHNGSNWLGGFYEKTTEIFKVNKRR